LDTNDGDKRTYIICIIFAEFYAAEMVPIRIARTMLAQSGSLIKNCVFFRRTIVYTPRSAPSAFHRLPFDKYNRQDPPSAAIYAFPQPVLCYFSPSPLGHSPCLPLFSFHLVSVSDRLLWVLDSSLSSWQQKKQPFSWILCSSLQMTILCRCPVMRGKCRTPISISDRGVNSHTHDNLF
jgi:hypothetical protein